MKETMQKGFVKKRIGVILDAEFTIDIRVLNEVNYLKSAGYEIHILCPAFDGQALREEFQGVTIHRFRLSRTLKNKLFGLMNTVPFYEWLWIREIRKFVQVVSPDYLHAHDLFMSKSAYKGGSGIIPVVLDLHENFPAAVQAFVWSTRFPHRLLSRPADWRRKEHEYLSYASRIIVLKNSFKESLTRLYPDLNPANLYEYPNVPDLEQMRNFAIKADIFPKDGRFVLFYFGGIGARRGIFTCFEAIKILSGQIPSVHLLLIGPVDGHEQAIFREYLTDPVLKEKVTHYEWKELSDFPSYTLASDVCLSPIIKDDQHESGVANKVFQYMLFARPLIVSDCAPQIEIVEGNRCGLVFQNRNAADLAEKISILYHNPELRAEMGERGKQAVLEKYNLEICGKQLELLYQSFVK